MVDQGWVVPRHELTDQKWELLAPHHRPRPPARRRHRPKNGKKAVEYTRGPWRTAGRRIQTVQLLELFLHREGRIPAARETIRVDGDTVKLGAWLAKTRTKHRARQLPDHHVRLVAALFEGDWTAEDAVPAVLV
jgi:hypothetical protein